MKTGAKGGTRTLKGLAPLAPKASASTNSATFALARAIQPLSIPAPRRRKKGSDLHDLTL